MTLKTKLKTRLLRAYFALESVYYNAMDALQAAKIPVYKLFVNPIESRGIPSFPIALLVLAVLAGATIALFSFTPASQLVFGSKTGLTVFVKEGDSPVENALVLITYDGITRAYNTTDADGKTYFTVPLGKTLRVDAEKDSKYASKTTAVKESASITIQFGA